MAKGVCQRCGFIVEPHTRLRKEWTNLLVCRECWDPKPSDLSPPRIRPEGLPVRNPSPEPEPIFREEGELGGDDL
jgi:hypothetical protein